MRGKKILVLAICFVVTALSALAASPQETYYEARRDALSAWLSLASYDDKPGEAARDELRRRGWDVDNRIEKDDRSETKFHIARKGKETFIAVTGTESLADVKSDLNLHSIPYRNGEAADMRVHAGFSHYTQTLLDAPYEETTLGQFVQADAALQDVILTGHSLGGAVALLTAARLYDDGVRNLQVVTFGAPAVGNSAFNETYEPLLQLDRIVMTDDPVKGILQTVSGTYSQFSKETVWQSAPSTQRFAHDIVGYADTALRRYYDAKGEYEAFLGHSLEVDPAQATGPSVFVLPLSVKVDPLLSGDGPYMEKAADDQLTYRLRPFFGPAGQSLTESLQEARDKGCTALLVRTVTGKRAKDKAYDFVMTYEEIWYDAGSGAVRSAFSMTMNTEKMTPILTLLAMAGMAGA